MTVDKNDFFRQVTLRISSSLNIETAMSRCIEYLSRFMPADEMYMGLFEQELGILRSIARATDTEGEVLEQIIPISAEAKAAIEKDSQMKVRIVNRPDLHPVIRSVLKIIGNPDRSTMVLHLDIEGKRMGDVILFSKGEDRYLKTHSDLLSLVSEPFAIAMSNALKHQELVKLKEMLADDNRYLHQELRNLSGNKIVGEDFGLKKVVEMVRQVAPLNNPVLILGETGTGKEVIANAIHYSSPRKNGPFIKVNCGAIPETLLDSELFGHEKGSFTGALAQKRGRFERAHNGTIFLDEIGELPLNAQVRLLRVIQNREIERVGGSTSVHLDIRIITATHRKLENMVASGEFREDLWFRINIFPIFIPPLRQRKMDISALLRYFIEKKTKEIGSRILPTLAQGTIDRLSAYHWPGNVRELENVVERAIVLCRDNILRFDQFVPFGQPQWEPDVSPDISTDQAAFERLDNLIEKHIRQALRLTGGKVHGPGGAAELLGTNPNTLRNKMKKAGIPFGRNDKRT